MNICRNEGLSLYHYVIKSTCTLAVICSHFRNMFSELIEMLINSTITIVNWCRLNSKAMNICRNEGCGSL